MRITRTRKANAGTRIKGEEAGQRPMKHFQYEQLYPLSSGLFRFDPCSPLLGLEP
jgi:hypothetical protein